MILMGSGWTESVLERSGPRRDGRPTRASHTGGASHTGWTAMCRVRSCPEFGTEVLVFSMIRTWVTHPTPRTRGHEPYGRDIMAVLATLGHPCGRLGSS